MEERPKPRRSMAKTRHAELRVAYDLTKTPRAHANPAVWIFSKQLHHRDVDREGKRWVETNTVHNHKVRLLACRVWFLLWAYFKRVDIFFAERFQLRSICL